jgi:hypothetical protein
LLALAVNRDEFPEEIDVGLALRATVEAVEPPPLCCIPDPHPIMMRNGKRQSSPFSFMKRRTLTAPYQSSTILLLKIS